MSNFYYYYYPGTPMIRTPTYYYNSPFVQRETLYVPQKAYHTYFQNPQTNTFIESIQYDQIQTDYLNIPTDEYVVVKTSKLNTRRKNEKGFEVKESAPGPMTFFNYKSPFGIPSNTVFQKLGIRNADDKRQGDFTNDINSTNTER